MTLRQLGEFAQKLVENGTIRGSFQVDGDDWANYMLLAMSALLDAGKLSRSMLGVNGTAPSDFDLKGGEAILPKELNPTAIDSIQFIDAKGNVVCGSVSRVQSTQATLLCDTIFKHYYIMGNLLKTINAPTSAKKVRIYEFASSDLDTEISDTVGYKILNEALKMAKFLTQTTQDTTVNGNNQTDTVDAQYRAYQNQPNNIN